MIVWLALLYLHWNTSILMYQCPDQLCSHFQKGNIKGIDQRSDSPCCVNALENASSVEYKTYFKSLAVALPWLWHVCKHSAYLRLLARTLRREKGEEERRGSLRQFRVETVYLTPLARKGCFRASCAVILVRGSMSRQRLRKTSSQPLHPACALRELDKVRHVCFRPRA